MTCKSIRAALFASGACLAAVPAEAQSLNFSDFYVGGAISSAGLGASSGGFNTVGGFANADCFPPEGFPTLCSNSASVVSGSVFAGFDNLAMLGPATTLRMEGEVSFYGDSDYLTGSFPGTSPIGFFYDTEVSSHRAGFINAYLDHALDEKFTLFAGAGVGLATMTVMTSDGVVEALPQSDTNFAWNAGFGLNYQLRPGLDLFTQYRYVDFGTADVDLTTIFGGAPAGS